jgi:hypothetical protein
MTASAYRGNFGYGSRCHHNGVDRNCIKKRSPRLSPEALTNRRTAESGKVPVGQASVTAGGKTVDKAAAVIGAEADGTGGLRQTCAMPITIDIAIKATPAGNLRLLNKNCFILNGRTGMMRTIAKE